METLIIVDAQHKSQYYSRSRSQGLARFNSTPIKNFREINCRTFHATKGILPSPRRASSIAAIKVNLKSPTAEKATGASRPKSTPKSTPIPIKTKPPHKEPLGNGFFNDSLSFSERWAGPTYSNSPPPSSLPIPKFLQLPKRTMSLDLPRIVSDVTISMPPIAKSAPASPTRDFSPLTTKDLCRSADSATKTLRRILNLDSYDE